MKLKFEFDKGYETSAQLMLLIANENNDFITQENADGLKKKSI